MENYVYMFYIILWIIEFKYSNSYFIYYFIYYFANRLELYYPPMDEINVLHSQFDFLENYILNRELKVLRTASG